MLQLCTGVVMVQLIDLHGSHLVGTTAHGTSWRMSLYDCLCSFMGAVGGWQNADQPPVLTASPAASVN